MKREPSARWSIPQAYDSAVAASLETRPTSAPAPPVTTSLQELPLDQLEWKNFERLCLRLAQLESEVRECRLYGVAGDKQDGIDLYARRTDSDQYRVYQCKRERKFGPARITEAVEEFLKGEWRATATEFYICSMESFSPRQRDARLRQERTRLEVIGIRLVSWDSDELNRILKRRVEVVDDFFGRAWAELFCGREAVERLGERLDGQQSAQLRRGLASLYLSLFRQSDPTFGFRDPAGPARRPLSLPDLLTDEDTTAPHGARASANGGHRSSVNGPSTRELELGPLYQAEATSGRQYGLQLAPERRVGAGAWLSTVTSALIVGDPGAGKTTLLRAIALDLLSGQPELDALARAFGNRLPLWVPFGRWTAMLASDGGAARVALPHLLEDWLVLHGASDLLALVRQALSSGELVLLVDGLDEWQTSQSARNALMLLQVFAAKSSVPVIATCRPSALEAIARPAGWRLARVALGQY